MMNSSKIKSITLRTAVAGVILSVLVTLGGCNTMAGLGQDIESGGSAMEGAARDVQQGD